jgi:hypothetical protein
MTVFPGVPNRSQVLGTDKRMVFKALNCLVPVVPGFWGYDSSRRVAVESGGRRDPDGSMYHI